MLRDSEFGARITPNLEATKASYGTVLFFDDPESANNMPPHVREMIHDTPEWADQANGMAQFIVWTAFATEGIGVSIQHYQKEGLMKQINVEWGLPLHWDLKCQMPFGAPDGPPRGGVPKQFVPIEPRVKIIGGS